MAKDISPKNPKGKKGDKDKKDRKEDRKTGAISKSTSVIARPVLKPPLG